MKQVRPNLRKIVDPNRRVTPNPLLDEILLKIYHHGISEGYMKAYEEIAEKKLKARDNEPNS